MIKSSDEDYSIWNSEGGSNVIRKKSKRDFNRTNRDIYREPAKMCKIEPDSGKERIKQNE